METSTNPVINEVPQIQAVDPAASDSGGYMAKSPRLDRRSHLAKARDEWLASPQGESCMGPVILRSMEDRQYLQNRLVSAFIAGARWQKDHQAKQ